MMNKHNYGKQVSGKNGPGFTLIELLVVISVLGLLASILMVALNSARIKSRDSYRIATLSQVSKALDLYYDKYQYYPAIHNCAEVNPSAPPPCIDDVTNIGEYTDQNWNNLITLLRSEKFLAEYEPPHHNLLAGLLFGETAQAAAQLLQDPQYPAKSFQYMVSVQPDNQNYRIRAQLEDPKNQILKSSISGKFIYNNPGYDTGVPACDASLNFYCVGPGGSYSTYLPGKPVIYLYPTKDEQVSVKVGALSVDESIPEYNNGWSVLAHPNGELKNILDGKTYSYLYWEGRSNKPVVDTSKGFVVKDQDVEIFLQKSLAAQGLSVSEAKEFIDYWAPHMHGKPYVYVYFMPQPDYDKLIPLSVSPKPDTVIRVYMLFKQLNQPIKVEPEKFVTPVREGFTVVEWGGDRSQIK